MEAARRRARLGAERRDGGDREQRRRVPRAAAAERTEGSGAAAGSASGGGAADGGERRGGGADGGEHRGGGHLRLSPAAPDPRRQRLAASDPRPPAPGPRRGGSAGRQAIFFLQIFFLLILMQFFFYKHFLFLGCKNFLLIFFSEFNFFSLQNFSYKKISKIGK